MKRRELLKGLTILPLAGAVSGSAFGAPLAVSEAAKKAAKSIYETIGVRPLINARGTVTVVGACQLLPEAQEAMDLATKEYVQIDELMDAVGDRLAEITGAEYGCVTAGASAAVTAGTALADP
jgi:D-glucosaminate-6-phosphate ammonia-lyase